MIKAYPIILLILVAQCQSPDKNLPPKTSSPKHTFHFFVMGDWGRRGKISQWAVARQLIAYAQKSPPICIITTGDNFYQQGVRSVTDPHWKESFTDIYKDLTRTVDWYPVLGNHDYQGHANPQAQIDYQRVNPRWHMPNYYYTMVATTPDSQRVRFLFIDTNPFYTLYYHVGSYPYLIKQDTARQRRWIDSTLANAKEEWKIVVGHHPVYSAGGEHGITPELINMLKPMFEKYKVQAYLCGHEHNLQHLQPTGSYTDYIVSGGGGDVTSAGRITATKFGKAVPGFADITIRNDSLWLQFIDKDGRIIYNYARRR
jgi:tartrate-resistant acid phosphatase type 5